MKIQQKKLSDQDEKQLVQDYQDGVPISDLLNKYGYSTRKSIYDKIKKHYPLNYTDIIEKHKSTQKKEYSINIIDNKFKAYFIGLLLTDGYIYDDRIELDLCDEDCISFVSNILQCPYHKYENKKDSKPIYRIAFRNQAMVNDLERFGIVQKKSYTIPYLTLYPEEEKYIPYLIRGIIDGDGCIYWTSKHTIGFYIGTMSNDFACWLKDTLENKLFMDDICITQQSNKIWIVRTHKYSNIFKLLALVYDVPFGMQRKYNALREMFRDYNKND